MFAALYIDRARGPYPTLGVDCWDEARDATRYPGPHPVIAHPPCEAWGRYHQRARQDRRHLALQAVGQVRRWCGILEHPAHSRLWGAAGLPRPGDLPDGWGGRTVEVEQGWWGHPAPKRTWLYVVGVELAPLPIDRRTAPGLVENLAKTKRHLTPDGFARWLLSARPLHTCSNP